ncbi:hypothetical protein IMSAGC001_04204 [Bacteroides acidifaciens]|uniref:Uncharacterized protein n=1 Tax=Bacteroides acidifaciens TaxID=85831 RepID=A0A7J0A9X1_9BACE|nr:hypothetical protein IMSAGC001_04204 [Bacteroides acidifaciens]
MHIIEAPLESECLADIRRFEHRVCLVEFISGGVEGIVHRLTDMLEVQFAIVKELAFFLPVLQVGAGCQLDRIAPESFLHTSPVVHFFILRVNPFIEEKIGYISQQQGACIFNRLETGKVIICRMMPVVAETLGKGTDVNQVIRFENDKRGGQYSRVVNGYV